MPIHPYIRVMAALLSESEPSAGTLRARMANELLPGHLRHLCDQLAADEINNACNDVDRNRRTYHALGLKLIQLLLQRDRWQLIFVNNRQVEHGVFGLPQPVCARMPRGLTAAAVFASRDRTRRLYFYFHDQAGLGALAETLRKQDAGRYRQIAVLVLPARGAMDKWRAVSRAGRWPRGFFVALDELRVRCAEAVPKKYQMLCSPVLKTKDHDAQRARIATFTAKLRSNTRVGGKDAPYYKLQFEAPGLTDITPGQFIMLDTIERKPTDGVRPMPWRDFTKSFATAPQTYLKRPFGIHRAFYRYFERDYLCRLKLPRSLAMVMHTASPKAFDVFYKVLPAGKGTHAMRKLARGARVEMIGPLGRMFDVRTMVNQGVDEVHVIGGGVGMAPLIFLVQVLRYLGVMVKAFIGIETIELLKRCQDDHIDDSFTAGARDANIYINDLTDAGVARADIFVSYNKASVVGRLVLPGNYSQGLVSELYKRQLSGHSRHRKIVVFACGPTPMMKAIHEITRAHALDLYVFMEKRMACGIGVCLSCVCRTTTSSSGYARVCKDGPIFNANEIVWP